MNALKVDVPDEQLAMDIESWEDGKEYQLRVRQVAPGTFTALEAIPAPPLEEVETEEPEGEGMGEGMMTGNEVARPPYPAKKAVPAGNENNPAIALVIAAGKKPKK